MAGPVALERWFAHHGAPPALDLARSGAPALRLRDLIACAGEDALAELLDASLDYGDGRGSAAMRDAIASAGAARSADDVVVTHGAIEALLLTCAALLGRSRRRRVLVGVPAYEALLRTPAAVGAEVVAVSVRQAGRAMLDLSALTERVDERVAAVLVNSPHNPTGAVADPGSLEALARRCADAGAVLVVDEVAVRTLDDGAPHACDIAAYGAGTVVAIGDVSKGFGLGGLRIGWLATASAAVRDAAAAVKDLTTVGNAAPSELLAAWALRRRETLLAPVRDVAGANLEVLQRWIEATPGASLTPPRDGLVAFPRIPDAGIAAVERLRRERGVAVVPGELFGAPGHVRFGLGVAPDRFRVALQRLRSPAG